jgi:hypothetical protein
MDKIMHIPEYYRPNDNVNLNTNPIDHSVQRVNSKIEVYNDAGELIFGPLHNKTVIAGSAFMAMKAFDLDRNCLDATPTYDSILSLDNAASGTTYPTAIIKDNDGNTIGSIPDESQRKIIGFCVGQGGAGLDPSDVFSVNYCEWITPDNLVPFRYPLASADDVPEDVYHGKKSLTLSNGQNRVAYYFKGFSNTPNLVQNFVTSIGSFSDTVTPETVYSNTASADKAQSYVELHLKITKDDCRDYFITHKGLENAKINQISLVTAWTKTTEVTKLNRTGSMSTYEIEDFQDIRPFSLVNIPNEILSTTSKSVSLLYTLYF